jgi:hypothetical protein
VVRFVQGWNTAVKQGDRNNDKKTEKKKEKTKEWKMKQVRKYPQNMTLLARFLCYYS